MTRSPKSLQPGLVALVLASAAGLLVVGLLSLWHALLAAEASARDEARQAAAVAATAIRRSLLRPGFVEDCPERFRFALLPTGIQRPAKLVWMTTPPHDDARVPWEVENRLRSAEAAEFAESEPERAATLLDEALARPGLAPDSFDALRIARAWLADRQADAATRGRMLAALTDADEPAPSHQASILLLAARAGRPLPPFAEACLLRLGIDEARALLARLREIRPSVAGTVELARAVERAEARRATLRSATELASSLLEARTPVLRFAGGRVLVYRPSGDERGNGALIPTAELSGLVEGAGALRFGPAPSAESLPAFEGAWIEAQQTAAGGLWSDPLPFATLLVVLTLGLLLGLAQIFRSMRAEREALAKESAFLESVTHELRTPLSSIRLFSEMLVENRVPSQEKREDYYRLLGAEAGRLGALVENVLDLGRIERGERAYDRQRIDLDACVRETIELFEPIAGREGFAAELTPAASPVLVDADAGAMRQVFVNLCENALRYARGGGVVEVGVSLRDHDGFVTVCDRGPGIPSEERERVFDRFERGTAHRDGAIPGLGLGLYLARKILEAHGGSLRCLARADAATGARFELAIPLSRTLPRTLPTERDE